MRSIRKIWDESMSVVSWMFMSLMMLAPLAFAAGENSGKIDRYVFAISANYGGANRPMLRYAESDAKSFANVIGEMGGTPKQNIYFVREPSISYLQKQFNALDAKLKVSGKTGREEVLVYYSGHADEKGLRLGNEVYGWQEFRKRVDALNADVKIAVIDACGSGAITRAKGGVAVPAFMVDQSSDMKGYAFITSSTQDESSQESDKLKGSFFTHSLVSGLRGAGDMSGDGKVTLSEAYQFAFNETLSKTESTMGGAQHPSRDMSLTGTGDVVMTDLRSTKAGLALDKNLEGRIFIRDGKGELVAELYKKAGREMSLGLPAGKYAVRVEKTAELKETVVTLHDGKLQNVDEKNMKRVDAEKTVARGKIGETDNRERVDSLDHNGKTHVSFNVVDIEKDPRKGLMMGLFLTKSDDILLGSQVSLIGNIAREEIQGVQAALVFNVAKGKMEGLQLSSAFNYADHLNGVQIGNINAANEAKVQVGPINLAQKTTAEVGVINIGKKVDAQVGVINMAKRMDAVQVGIINASGRTTGRQIGLINIAGHAEKAPIGLFNFVGNGVWSATLSMNESNVAAASYHLGTAGLFTAVEFARQMEKGFGGYDQVCEKGLGLGTQFGRYGTHLELEYMFLFDQKREDDGHVYDYKVEVGSGTRENYHHRLRFGAVGKLFIGVGIATGVTLNLVTEGYEDKILLKPNGDWHDDWHFDGHKARFWPGLYAGITFGKF